MPLIRVTVDGQMAERQNPELLTELSRLAARETGKPEKYVMAIVQTGALLLAGKPGPAAFVELRGIGGLSPDVNKRIAKAVCQLLQEKLAIPGERVYLNFTDVPASNWGWNGGTFG